MSLLKDNILISQKGRCIDKCENDNIYKYDYHGTCYDRLIIDTTIPEPIPTTNLEITTIVEPVPTTNLEITIIAEPVPTTNLEKNLDQTTYAEQKESNYL